VSFVEDRHLGGYIAGGDDATWYPDLWSYLITTLGCERVLDVGCGEGHSTEYFLAAGAAVQPIDGIPQPHLFDRFVCHDFTRGPYTPRGVWDLAWCCEVVEHVEERYVPNLLATLTAARYIAMTHAEPGQQGYHHVNCQPASYWVGAMAAVGYYLSEQLTLHTRALAARNANPWNHYARSGLVFHRTPS
jgi:hypothetical protein